MNICERSVTRRLFLFHRSLYLWLVITALFGQAVMAQEDDSGRKYALLVGVRQYDPNQLRPLPYAEQDAQEMAKVLRDNGFRRVILLTQSDGATESRSLPLAKNVRTSLKGLLEDRKKDDLVLIGFAGHGVQFRGEKDNYFCPMDADLSDRKSLISLAEVYDQLEKSNAGTKLLLVDAYRNNPLAGNARDGGGVDLSSVTRPQIPDPPGGIAAMFSCSAGQQAFEHEKLKHGVFFHHVILGLNGAAKSRKRDEVTWDSLVEYVKDEVPDTVKDLLGDGVRQLPENKGRLRGKATLVSLTPSISPSEPSTRPSSSPASMTGKPTVLAWTFSAAQAKTTQEALAKSLGKNVIEKNSLGMEFVLIPPGKFTMGSPANEKDRDKDEDQVEVTLTSPFWLGKTEVTQGQWQQIMGTTPWKGKDYVKEGPDYAASYVSWEDAQEFVKQLSQRDGVTYRLPTEAEWEWSCRAGTSSRFSFGDNDSDLGRYGWYDGSRWYDISAKSERYVHKVGKKLANPFGLHDMHGNLWEWCEDMKIDKLPGGTDPKVLTGGNDRVLRGGAWFDVPQITRSANRFRVSPVNRDNIIGFRISRTQ